VLYSAALTPAFRPLRRATKAGLFPLLVDPVFAFAEKRLAEGRGFSPGAYLGMGIVLYVNWVAGSAIGAIFGQLVQDPEALSLDMVLPVYFLTLVMGFRARPGWGIVVATSAAVSIAVYHAPALGLSWLGPPWHITAGAAGGILAAVLVAGSGRPVPVAQAAQEETFEPAGPPSGEARR
jgi:predicted branched-subunit amino acid permease